MTRTSVAALALGASLLGLAGCTGMSGVGGTSSYACQAPEGVTCNSVSGVYANAIRNNLPGQRASQAAPPASVPQSGLPAGVRPRTGDSASNDELRSRPRVLRLWFKPWEDVDGDLFDQGYVYVQVDAGRWRVDHVQRRIREGFAPIRPPLRGGASSTSTGPGTEPRLPSEVQEPRQVPRPSPPTGTE